MSPTLLLLSILSLRSRCIRSLQSCQRHPKSQSISIKPPSMLLQQDSARALAGSLLLCMGSAVLVKGGTGIDTLLACISEVAVCIHHLSIFIGGSTLSISICWSMGLLGLTASPCFHVLKAFTWPFTPKYSAKASEAYNEAN